MHHMFVHEWKYWIYREENPLPLPPPVNRAHSIPLIFLEGRLTWRFVFNFFSIKMMYKICTIQLSILIISDYDLDKDMQENFLIKIEIDCWIEKEYLVNLIGEQKTKSIIYNWYWKYLKHFLLKTVFLINLSNQVLYVNRRQFYRHLTLLF